MVPASGGFATVHPGNKLTINVVEAAPLDAFSPEVSFTLIFIVVIPISSLRLCAQTCRRR